MDWVVGGGRDVHGALEFNREGLLVVGHTSAVLVAVADQQARMFDELRSRVVHRCRHRGGVHVQDVGGGLHDVQGRAVGGDSARLDVDHRAESVLDR
eukprot:750715-Hanusia_phi.AAC.2